MKTIITVLASFVVIVLGQFHSSAQPYTYVFIPQNDPTKPSFDHDLAMATITLKSDMGFFQDTPIAFTVYPGIHFDPMILDIEGLATATGLTIRSGGIITSGKTYFQTDEQILADAERDGKWVISTSVPDATGTLPLLLLAIAAFPVWWTFSRR